MAASKERAASLGNAPGLPGGRREIQPKRVGKAHGGAPAQPHFESPQFRHVMQPSIMTTAAVLHFVQSWAPCG